MHSHIELQAIINKEISELNFEKQPENLYEPIKYVMESGGKRIRPVLTLMACELFGGNYKLALNAALGIEIFHNFTLLHDDMMDNADIRRGMPVVHVKWNRNISLLSGDAMSIITYKLLCKSNINLIQILDVFSNTALNICEGQQYDMDYENKYNVNEDEYLEMIKLKTAVLIACSLKVGALTANASEIECNKIFNFGKNLGIAFQLQDDFLDVYGDVNKFGKKIGGDIISNKKTFLLVNALKKAEDKDKANLEYWLNAKEFDKNEKYEAVKNIFDNLNLKEYAENTMNHYFKMAFDYFDSIAIEKSKKNYIYDFANSLRYRDN